MLRCDDDALESEEDLKPLGARARRVSRSGPGLDRLDPSSRRWEAGFDNIPFKVPQPGSSAGFLSLTSCSGVGDFSINAFGAGGLTAGTEKPVETTAEADKTLVLAIW